LEPRGAHCFDIPASVSSESGFWKIIIYHDEYVLYWGALMRDFKNAQKYLVPLLLVVLLVSSASTALVIYALNNGNEAAHDVNVGVAFCGNTTAEAELLIDRVKSYTNLFILNAAGNPIRRNQTSIEEICDYAVAQGLQVIINVGFNSTDSPITPNRIWFWTLSSLDDIKQRWTERWGDKFLGMYYSDEPGGIQLDGDWKTFFTWLSALDENPPDPSTSRVPSVYVNAIHELYAIYGKIQEANGSAPADYDAEAEFFVKNVIRDDPGFSSLRNAGFKTFTSDYALYWFDYLGGYDVMLAQIGWNCSVAQQIDLVKGAAHMQNKEWGAIITWKYEEPPYLDSGEEIYNQMYTAYEAGAEYAIIFTYPQIEDSPYGTLKDEHFEALERLWDKVEQNPRKMSECQAEAAFVLPRNYGWGMRHPEDRIWGFWGPDEKSPQIWENSRKLLSQYGTRLDIVYDDPAFPVAGKYPVIYYWNQTL